MKIVKYSAKDTNKIDLGTKVIYKYPTPTRIFDISHMVTTGRNPEDGTKFILEHDCNFVLYVIKGSGRIFVGEEVFDLVVDDVVFVPSETKFATEGNMEYITVDAPAFYLEQSDEVQA